MTYANITAKAHQRHPNSRMSEATLVMTLRVLWISVKN